MENLFGKTVKNVCYMNPFGELVSYEISGPRGGIMQAIRYPNSNNFYLRNGKSLFISALSGYSTFTDKTGQLKPIN